MSKYGGCPWGCHTDRPLLTKQRRIYGQQGKQVDVFSEGSSLAVNPSYVRLWLNLLARTPRVAPFLANNAPIITALHKVRNLPLT